MILNRNENERTISWQMEDIAMSDQETGKNPKKDAP